MRSALRMSGLGLALCAALPAVVYAQSRPYTPKPGSIERKAIMDAVRIPVQREVQQNVVFEIYTLKVQNGWAFVNARPVQPGGKPVNYHGTRYQEDVAAGMFSGDVVALVHKTNGRWHVTRYELGATDVPYEGWPAKYHAPRAIFGM